MHSVATKDAVMISANRMRVGDIALIRQSDHHSGEYLLRTYSGYVLLNKPSVTWCKDTSMDTYKVSILPKGAELTITIGES